MALTDIARQLKDTFEGFEVSGLQDELAYYRRQYGDAELIRIGEMDYIVIDAVYQIHNASEENAADSDRRVPETISPLFFSSIHKNYAIIDAETSATLIDEVYSRVTYMQRICELDSGAEPEEYEIRKNMEHLFGEDQTLTTITVTQDTSSTDRKANIFQCQLIKDTGVSAAPDVYSFMLKDGEIKEIPDHVMRQIRRSGRINIFRDQNLLENNKSKIQDAVFNKYINSDLDVQSISVKSIFEIVMTFLDISLRFKDEEGRHGVYNTAYLASLNNEFETLNASIHVCNECRHELVDVRDPNKINHLHINTDAYASETNTEEFAIGCENCLVQCPNCGGWHINYEKFIGSDLYDRLALAKGRSFIRGLHSIEANYCYCREGIEWVYDEFSGTDEEHDVIPIKEMAFVNYAHERIATYDDYLAFCARKHGRKTYSAVEESKHAAQLRADFKKSLASDFGIDVKDIRIASNRKCNLCTACGGQYYNQLGNTTDESLFRCDACDILLSEKRKSVTRTDGIVFMCHKGKIRKYVMTKLGNLKEVPLTFAKQAPLSAGSADSDGDTAASSGMFD